MTLYVSFIYHFTYKRGKYISVSEIKISFIKNLRKQNASTYLIKGTDLKKSLYVNKVQTLFFYSSMRCCYFLLMTINGSLMAINVPLVV